MHEGLPEGTLTLLFTDVEGSTDLTTRLGDEAAQKILRSHIDRVALRAAFDDAPEVARMLPSLRRVFPDAPSTLELPPEQERHCLFKSVLDFLEGLSENWPLLLVIDDRHWSDDSALLLLQHLGQRLP